MSNASLQADQWDDQLEFGFVTYPAALHGCGTPVVMEVLSFEHTALLSDLLNHLCGNFGQKENNKPAIPQVLAKLAPDMPRISFLMPKASEQRGPSLLEKGLGVY